MLGIPFCTIRFFRLGYTFHQGSFLYVTASGDVVLNKVVTNDSVRQGERRLSRTRRPIVMPQPRQRQGLREMCRDILGNDYYTNIYVHILCNSFITSTINKQCKNAKFILYCSF